MRIVEIERFPHDDRYAGLRWIRGSGLQRRDKDGNLVEETLDDLRLNLQIEPNYGIKSVDKPGNSLIVGDPANRTIKLTDPGDHVNSRFVEATKSAAPKDVRLFKQQNRTLLGAAGGIRGRLKLQIDTNDANAGTDAPWAIVTATYLPHDAENPGDTEAFIAQADARGEFTIDLAGIRWPDDDTKPAFTLSIESLAGLKADKAADPDKFVDFRISTDGTAGNLQAGFAVTLDNYGEVKKLGNLLVAPV